MTALAHRVHALQSLSGCGIEIGAYHSPLPLPPACQVEYVDLYSPEDAARIFPEADNAQDRVVRPTHLAPADDLPMFGSGSLDFVLNSHLVEHLADPIGGLREWHRVLRPGGRLFLAVPDRRYTFDRRRSATPLEHVIQDHLQGSAHPERHARDREHFLDWARHVNGLREPGQVAFWAELLSDGEFPIHYHCWQVSEFLPMIEWLGQQGHGFEVLETAESPLDGEFVVLLEKRSAVP